MKIISLRNLLIGLASGVLLSSCGEDDPAPPDASFTYVAEEREVTFTNTSKNAKTFSWDFGDGETSTDENPVHTYDAFGKYTVQLTVTGDGGTDASLPDEITLAKSSVVVIDGNVSEWASLPDVLVSTPEEDGGTITKVKVDFDATKIYFYVEGTSELRGFFDFYLDSNNDPETGYVSGWYPLGFGADHLSEGDFANVHDADIFKYLLVGDDNTQWSWEVASATGSGSINSSGLVTVGEGKAIEISFLRSGFSNLSSQGFSFAVVDVDGTVDPEETVSWEKLGSLPVDNTENSIMKFFDISK